MTPHEYASVANIFFSRSFFPIDERARVARLARRNARTRDTKQYGMRGGRVTTFQSPLQPPRITFQMNRPPRGPLFVFNISPVARAKDRPFLYFSLPPARPLFPVRPSRLSSPLFVIRAPMFNFAGYLERGGLATIRYQPILHQKDVPE